MIFSEGLRLYSGGVEIFLKLFFDKILAKYSTWFVRGITKSYIYF